MNCYILIKNLNMQQEAQVVASCLLQTKDRPSIGDRIADALGYDTIYPPEIIPIEEQVEEEILEPVPEEVASPPKRKSKLESEPVKKIDHVMMQAIQKLQIDDNNEMLKLKNYFFIIAGIGFILMILSFLF